jgi:hypothetical protein
MNEEVLQYLANLSVVRKHASDLANVGRGTIDKTTLHKLSAKTVILDKLFSDTLLSGSLPGKKQAVLIEDDDDDIDFAAKLAAAKANLKKKPEPVKVEEPDEEEQEDEEIPELEPARQTTVVKTNLPTTSINNERSAFDKLLNSIEDEVSEPVKKTAKKTAKKAPKKHVTVSRVEE